MTARVRGCQCSSRVSVFAYFQHYRSVKKVKVDESRHSCHVRESVPVLAKATDFPWGWEVKLGVFVECKNLLNFSFKDMQ